MNHGPWTNLVLVEILWFFTHRCFSEHTANLYKPKRDTVVFLFFFREERCLDLEGVHLQNFKKTLIAHKCPKEMNLSRAFSWIAQITCHLALEMRSLKQNNRRNGTSINFTRVKVDGSFIKHQPVKQYLAQSEALLTFRAKLPMAETVG